MCYRKMPWQMNWFEAGNQYATAKSYRKHSDIQNKELRDFGEYRTQRLVLAALDKLEPGELS